MKEHNILSLEIGKVMKFDAKFKTQLYVKCTIPDFLLLSRLASVLLSIYENYEKTRPPYIKFAQHPQFHVAATL